MNKLKIVSYNKLENCHVCVDETGYKHRVDIMVDGGLIGNGETEESMVGRTIYCNKLTPYMEIAHGVIRVEDMGQ